MFFFHTFPSVLLYDSNVRVFSLVLDRQQSQTGASPCGQEEEDLSIVPLRETALYAPFTP